MTTSKKVEKTVYVLGAGFSAPAGGPAQARLMDQIFGLRGVGPRVSKAQRLLKKFLVDDMRVRPEKISDATLEDFYTPIDRCLADGVALRGRSADYLESVRGSMEYLISVAINSSIDHKHSSDPKASAYVREFARYLVRVASVRAERAAGERYADSAKAYDPFSVISLNWDVLLDKEIYRALERMDHHQDSDYAPIGVVDYCCYISSVERNERRIRAGLWALGARGYNVKLLKLHGSMNWLQCSNCQRLFVSFDRKITIPNYIDTEECRHCRKYKISATLQGSLIMPTFLKDLSNFQIKLIWQNAAVELMEADRVVFIGYSLPESDFEFRQLLSRMVRKDARVDVILFQGRSAVDRRRYNAERRRYRQFFGRRTVTVSGAGVERFVETLV